MTPRAGDGIPGFSDRELPLAAGTLTGVRLWHVDLAVFDAVSHAVPAVADGLLTGVFGASWHRGENVAVCGGGRRPAAGHPDQVPAVHCGCGFWAYWLPRDALRSDYRRAGVIGVMQGYGRTRIGTRGCRCSKARILALHVHSAAPDLRAWDLRPQHVAEILGRYYGVPWYESLEEMLAAHPPTADYLPRRQQRAVSLPSRPASPGPVSWPRVAALAAAYVALAAVLITLAAAWWGPRATAVIAAVTVAGATWPIGTRWLPRWVRKLAGAMREPEARPGEVAAAPHAHRGRAAGPSPDPSAGRWRGAGYAVMLRVVSAGAVVTSRRWMTFSVTASCAVRSARASTPRPIALANTSQVSAGPAKTSAAIRDHRPTAPMIE